MYSVNSRYWIAIAALIIISITLFAGAVHSSFFVWDEQSLIVNNVFIRNIKNIPVLFKPGYWMHYHLGGKGQYRPVRTLTFVLDYRLWRLNAVGYHLTNVLLHIVNVILVFFLSLTIFNDRGSKDNKLIILGFLTALLFSTHPMHVENIAWIKNRSDMLASIFLISGFLLFVKRDGAAGRRTMLYISSLFCYLLSICSKETGLVLPFMLIAYIILLMPRERRKTDMLMTLPFFAIMALFLLFKTSVLGSFFSGQKASSIGLYNHILLIFKTIGYYFRLLISPFDFNVERPLIIPTTLVEPGVILSLILIVFCLGAGWIIYKRGEREALFSLSWIFIALLPVANIVFLADRPIAEQRLYAPSVGFCLLLSYVGYKLLKGGWGQPKGKVFRSSIAVLLIILVSSYSIATVKRNNDWKDPIRFWSETVRVNPNSAKAYYNLGNEYMAAGLHKEAIPYYEKSIEMDPEKADAYNNLGAAYKRLGDDDKAIEFYRRSIKIEPGYVQAYVNLGLYYGEIGRIDEAEEMYKKAIDREPYHAEAYNNLGFLYESKGDSEKALELYDKAIMVNDLYATAYYNKGVLYAKREMADRALFFFEKTIEIDNNHSDAYFNLGVAYNLLGKKSKAVRMLKKSINIDSQPDAYMILSMVYYEMNDFNNAAIALEGLVKIDPTQGGAYHRLAIIYYMQKRYELAVKNCDKAVDLGVIDNDLLNQLEPVRDRFN